MSSLTIKTNNKWRNFVYRSDVPAKVLDNQFSHLAANEFTDGFVCYRGCWYHTSDFMRVEECAEFKGWDGYASDSMFSGVLIKMSQDGERAKLATYFS